MIFNKSGRLRLSNPSTIVIIILVLYLFGFHPVTYTIDNILGTNRDNLLGITKEPIAPINPTSSGTSDVVVYYTNNLECAEFIDVVIDSDNIELFEYAGRSGIHRIDSPKRGEKFSNIRTDYIHFYTKDGNHAYEYLDEKCLQKDGGPYYFDPNHFPITFLKELQISPIISLDVNTIFVGEVDNTLALTKINV